MRISGKRKAPQFLSGWKEIASYLGKGVRTVQRYERELALPVRRPAGKAKGSVVATPAELDAWVGASPIREAFQLRMPNVEASSITSVIRAGVREMVRLRAQMLALRDEVTSSVRALNTRVYLLQGKLNRNFWTESELSETTDPADQRRLLETFSLTVPGGRKAS